MRNRRNPSAGLDGEILPPEAPSKPSARATYSVPAPPVLREFRGAFNLVAHMHQVAQAKGFTRLATTLDRYEDALRSQLRAAEAYEALVRQEDRLKPENMNILLETDRRDIDAGLAHANGRLMDAQMRNQQAYLAGQIAEERLQTELIRARRRREKEEDRDDTVYQAGKRSKEVPVEDQIAALSAEMKAIAERLAADDLSDAEEMELDGKARAIKTKLDELYKRQYGV